MAIYTDWDMELRRRQGIFLQGLKGAANRGFMYAGELIDSPPAERLYFLFREAKPVDPALKDLDSFINGEQPNKKYWQNKRKRPAQFLKYDAFKTVDDSGSDISSYDDSSVRDYLKAIARQRSTDLVCFGCAGRFMDPDAVGEGVADVFKDVCEVLPDPNERVKLPDNWGTPEYIAKRVRNHEASVEAQVGLVSSERLKVGDIVEFGAYPQDHENQWDPIEWIVLETRRESALLLSRKGLAWRDLNGSCDRELGIEGFRISVDEWLAAFTKAAFQGDEEQDLLDGKASLLTIQDILFKVPEEHLRCLPTKIARDHAIASRAFYPRSLVDSDVVLSPSVFFTGRSSTDRLQWLLHPDVFAPELWDWWAKPVLDGEEKVIPYIDENGRAADLIERAKSLAPTDSFLPANEHGWTCMDMQKLFRPAVRLSSSSYSATLRKHVPPMPEDPSVPVLTVGEIKHFGRFSFSGKTDIRPIEWRVIATDGREFALLISEYGLDAVPFNESMRDGNKYSRSRIRKWMRHFSTIAFTDEEWRRIAEGPFLLTARMAESFFDGDVDRVCKATPFAISRGAIVTNDETEGACYWWLQDKGSTSENASFVFPTGEICSGGQSVDYRETTVRPAILISI